MKMRFVKGVTIAVAVGSVVCGSATFAAGSTPNVGVTWTEGKQFPSPATRWDGGRVGSKVYFLGFRIDDAGTTDGSVYSYNIGTNKFKDTGIDMKVPVSNYTVSVLKDATGTTGLYIFGGRDASGAIVDTVQVYYPGSNTAKILKSDPWPGTTPSGCVSLPATGVATVGNIAYVIGGMAFTTSIPPCGVDENSAQTWSFDPTKAAGHMWKQGPDLKVGLGYISPAVIGKTIYAIGGDDNQSSTLVASPTVESWKIGAAAWDNKDVADLPVASSGVAGCDESQAFGYSSGPLAGTITLAGCGQWTLAVPDVFQYNVSRNKWSNIGALNEARRNHAGVDIGSAKHPKMMVVGGYAGDGSTILQTSEIGTPNAAKGTSRVYHPASSAGKPSLF